MVKTPPIAWLGPGGVRLAPLTVGEEGLPNAKNHTVGLGGDVAPGERRWKCDKPGASSRPAMIETAGAGGGIVIVGTIAAATIVASVGTVAGSIASPPTRLAPTECHSSEPGRPSREYHRRRARSVDW
jgi:hypothetical protein